MHNSLNLANYNSFGNESMEHFSRMRWGTLSHLWSSNSTYNLWTPGGSPVLVVTGGNSYSKGREFESQHCILDGQFPHLFEVKIAMFVWKDEKEAEDRPFFIICDHVTCKKLLSSFTVKLTTLVGRLGSLPPTTKVLHDMTKDIPPTLTYVLMPSFYLLLLLSLEGEPLRSKQNSVWSLFCLNLSQHKLVSKISWNNSNSRQRFAIAFFVINAFCDCVYEWFSN